MNHMVPKNFTVAWLSQSSNESGIISDKSDQFRPPTEGPSSPSNSYGYSSGSDVEVGEDSETEVGLIRRVRTKYTSFQIAQLEKSFMKHKYLDAEQRRRTADKLELSETQVKTWFQNRRMKLKREVQDTQARHLNPALSSPSIFQPLLPFQHHMLSGQLIAPVTYPLYRSRASLLHQHQQSNLQPTLLTSSYY